MISASSSASAGYSARLASTRRVRLETLPRAGQTKLRASSRSERLGITPTGQNSGTGPISSTLPIVIGILNLSRFRSRRSRASRWHGREWNSFSARRTDGAVVAFLAHHARLRTSSACGDDRPRHLRTGLSRARKSVDGRRGDCGDHGNVVGEAAYATCRRTSSHANDGSQMEDTGWNPSFGCRSVQRTATPWGRTRLGTGSGVGEP